MSKCSASPPFGKEEGFVRSKNDNRRMKSEEVPPFPTQGGEGRLLPSLIIILHSSFVVLFLQFGVRNSSFIIRLFAVPVSLGRKKDLLEVRMMTAE